MSVGNLWRSFSCTSPARSRNLKSLKWTWITVSVCKVCEQAGVDHDLVVRRCLSSPAWAGYYLGGFKDVIDPVHMAIDEWLKIKMDQGSTRILVMVPRAHLKTHHIGIGETVRRLLVNPDERILAAMATRVLAEETLAVIERIFMGDAMRHFFPDRVLTPGTEGMKATASRMTIRRGGNWREPSVRALGVDSAKTGGHYTFQLFDDLIDETMRNSTVKQDSVIEFFRDATNLFVDVKSDIRIVLGTLWEGEYYDWLLYRSGIIDSYETLILGCYVDNRFRDFLASIGKTTSLEDGEPIWPERFSKEHVEKVIRLELGENNFSRQMLNIPVEHEYQRFRKEDFRQYKITDDYKYAQIGNNDENCTKVPLKRMQRIMIIDPATGEHKKTDESAINVTGFDRVTGKIFVLEDWAARALPHSLIDRIFELAEKWDVQYVCPEDISYQKTLKHYLLQEKAKRGGRFVIKPVKPEAGNRGGAGKGTRIEGLEPFVRAGQVHVRPEHSKLVREATEVNIVRGKVQGKSPNRLDAFAYQTQFWKGAEVPLEEQDDIEYWNPMRREGRQSRSYGLACVT